MSQPIATASTNSRLHGPFGFASAFEYDEGITPPGSGRVRSASPCRIASVARVTRIGWSRPYATRIPLTAPTAAPIARIATDQPTMLATLSCIWVAASVFERAIMPPTERSIPRGQHDDGLPDRDEYRRHRGIDDGRPLERAGERVELAVEEPDIDRGQAAEDREREEQRHVLRERAAPLRARSARHGRRGHRRHAASSRSAAATSPSASASGPESSETTLPSRMTRTRWQSCAISSVSLE